MASKIAAVVLPAPTTGRTPEGQPTGTHAAQR
jgi:hypothetical protein